MNLNLARSREIEKSRYALAQMSEYIRLNQFETNECPNVFVNEKLVFKETILVNILQ